jgi:hypothetical protein
MENEALDVVVEETAGSVLEKSLVIGGVVLTGLVAVLVVPKALKKLKAKVGRKTVVVEDEPEANPESE